MSAVAMPRMGGGVGGGFPRSGVGVSTWEELSTVWVAFRRKWLSTLPAATTTTKTATSPATIFSGATALLGGLAPPATPGIVGISALKRSSGAGDWSAMKRSSKAAICCVAMTQVRLRAQGASVLIVCPPRLRSNDREAVPVFLRAREHPQGHLLVDSCQ